MQFFRQLSCQLLPEPVRLFNSGDVEVHNPGNDSSLAVDDLRGQLLEFDLAEDRLEDQDFGVYQGAAAASKTFLDRSKTSYAFSSLHTKSPA